MRKMKKTLSAMGITALAAVSAAALTGCGNGGSSAEIKTGLEEAEEDILCSGAADFGFRLLAAAGGDVNPAVSPASAYVALAMAGSGAGGDTLDEFYEVLGRDMDTEAGLIAGSVPFENEYGSLLIADAAWLDDAAGVYDDWAENMEDRYNAAVRTADLQSMEAAAEINEWVSGNTGGLIEEMADGPFDEDVSLSLLNTVYFRAPWANPFASVKTGTFTTEDGTEQEADMMHATEYFKCFSVDGMTGVLLPYDDGDGNTVFIAVLPEEGTAVRDMLAGMDAGTLAGILELYGGYSGWYRVDLTMPEFEASADLNLKDSLSDMGLVSAFDVDTADFSGISGEEGLNIGSVRQKVKITVDKDGTEAAAATMTGMREMGSRDTEDPVELAFDRPFLYMIADADTGALLFAGIVDDVSQMQ